MDEIILLGAGGHTKACIDVIEAENKYSIAGLIENSYPAGKSVFGYPVIGSDNDLKRLKNKFQYAFITVGQTRDSRNRQNIYRKLASLGFTLPIIISPSAYVSKHAKIGSGTIIMHNVTVNADANIGSNCIINNHALIEHDVMIYDHCHISTGAIINGHSTINEGTLIGSGAVVNQCVEIALDCIIGSSSVVIKSIAESGIYVGNPLRRIQ